MEARHKGVQCLLAPTVCIHRHPLGGRNFESYSEDPFLTGKLAAQFIRAVQDKGVSATIKHFVANEQETQRTTVDETISERALREIYLRPFEMAVREARPWAVMTAYNLVNGVHCDANSWLIRDVLRGEWGWDGLVMSDWGGTNSVADALNAGLDLEMPGPPRKRRVPTVVEAVKRGEVTEAVVDERAAHCIRFAAKLKQLADAGASEAAGDRAEDRALIRDAGARGMVLLKNEGVLPLCKTKLAGKKIALIGLAKEALAHGGGSASVNAYYKTTPWEGLKQALGDGAELLYAKAFHSERLLPPIEGGNAACGSVVGLTGEPGFTRLFFNFDRDSRSVMSEEPESVLHHYPNSAYSVLGTQESLWRLLDIVGDFSPAETGSHYIACSGLGPTQIFVDDQVIFEQAGNCGDPMGLLFLAASEKEIRHTFLAGKTYRLRIRTAPPVGIGLDILEGRSGARLGMVLESVRDQDLKSEAAALAAEADVAIVFTGHTPQWETEGRDQDSFNLPRSGTQDAVVSAVAAANPNTIVVNSTGVPVAMPWLNDVRAVVQAWFPGQECGNSIADVLTGAVNPEGRLPVSFPRRIEDTPAYGNFLGAHKDGQLKVTYAEDVFVGYRHYDRMSREALNFPFGHGLSYTTFGYEPMTVLPVKGSLDVFSVALGVSNTGAASGAIVAQIYAGHKRPSPDEPVKSLVAFRKLFLSPGETRNIELVINARDFATFSSTGRCWVVKGGEYILSLGQSAADVLQTVMIELPAITYPLSWPKST